MQQRIQQVDLAHVRIPLHEPFRISTGEVSVKDSIIIRLETDAGVGYGEAAPMAGSFYNAETPESNWDDLVGNLIPTLIAKGSLAAAEVIDVLDGVSTQQFAKSGIETAYWVCQANAEGRPLWELMGSYSRAIRSGVAIGITDTVDGLLERVEKYLVEGYKRVKIKIGPGWDLEPLAQIRHAWPQIPLMVDANGAYGAEHIELLTQLDQYGLMMIEQPMAADALDASARLQSRIQTAICLDESASSLDAVRAIAEKGAGRIINVKMQRVGGVLRTRQMHDLAQSLELPCWIGTMPELGVASAAGLHAATMANCTFPTDIESSERWFVDDVLDPAISIDAGGLIHIPDGPGIGYQVNPEKIEKYAVRQETIRP